MASRRRRERSISLCAHVALSGGGARPLNRTLGDKVTVSDLVDGTPPALAGCVCEAFVCQQFLVDGQLEDGANVVFLKFGGVWWRCYFDGMIFWRSCKEPPQPFEVPEKAWSYPHVDIGALAGVIGRKLVRYEMSDGPMRVAFEFDNGKRIFIESRNDRGRCVVA